MYRSSVARCPGGGLSPVTIIWLQYAVYDPAWSPFVKFAIVFSGTLAGSWATVILLKKIPVVARLI